MAYQRVWTDHYMIHSYQADATAHATPTAMLQFMQESAWNHAEHLELGYSHLIKKDLAWVMVRLALKITALPQWHESITIDTFPSGRDKLFAYRDFRITAEHGDVLAVGTTTWLVIDINRRRPQRTDSYFHIHNWGDYDHAYAGFAPKVDALESVDATSERRVYFSHLDVNGHLNNVKYLEFVLDSLPIDFCETHNLAELNMNFMNEALLGDHVQIRTHKKDGVFLHALYGQNGKTELCRLASVWQQK